MVSGELEGLSTVIRHWVGPNGRDCVDGGLGFLAFACIPAATRGGLLGRSHRLAGCGLCSISDEQQKSKGRRQRSNGRLPLETQRSEYLASASAPFSELEAQSWACPMGRVKE